MEQTSQSFQLSDEMLQQMDTYWRAANYISVGQIYLLDNPLLKERLQIQHIKTRLLGHWGTTPGLNFIYVHLNRLIKAHDLNMIYICGPGHGGPGMGGQIAGWKAVIASITHTFLKMLWGLQKLFKQFFFSRWRAQSCCA